MDQEKELTISLKDVIRCLLKRWWIIVLTSFIGLAVGFSYTYFIKEKKYTATCEMYVNSKDFSIGSTSISLSDISASRSLVDTYKLIITSYDTIGQVIKYASSNSELSKDYTEEEVYKMISVDSVNKTEIFSISVTCNNPDDARDLADAFIEIFPDRVKDVITANGVDATLVESVRTKEVSRGLVKASLIGLAIGLVLSAAVVFVYDLIIDDTIDSVDAMKQMLSENMPLLAVVPDTVTSKRSGYGYKHHYGYHYHYHTHTPSEPEASESTQEKKDNE